MITNDDDDDDDKNTWVIFFFAIFHLRFSHFPNENPYKTQRYIYSHTIYHIVYGLYLVVDYTKYIYMELDRWYINMYIYLSYVVYNIYLWIILWHIDDWYVIGIFNKTIIDGLLEFYYLFCLHMYV